MLDAEVGVRVSTFVGRFGIKFVPNGIITGSAFAGDGLICEAGSCGDGVAIESALVFFTVERVGGSAVCRERSTAAIAAAVARASNESWCVVDRVSPAPVDDVAGDAVVGPAIALDAASGVDGPGGFKQRSTATAAAATIICIVKDVVEVSAPVARSDGGAPSPSATVALDCEAFDDVGGVV